MTDDTIDRAAFQRLREITGDDDAFLAELIDTYLDDGTQQVVDLLDAARGEDVPAMLRPAHSLKSASDSIGAMALAELCRILETEVRGGAVVDPVARSLAVATAFDAASTELLTLRPTV